MEQEMMEAVELAVRRLVDDGISRQLVEYRTYIQSQFDALKLTVGIVAAAGAIVITFFLGRSWLEMNSAIEGKVDSVFVQQDVQNRLSQKAIEITGSAETIAAIRGKVSAIVAEQTLRPSIDTTRAALDKFDASSNASTSLPLGTIVPSILEPVAMRAAGGGSWVLADGQDVSGTPYAALSGQNVVPDLRGLFLRGINQGRTDRYADPTGQRRVGDVQVAEIQAHSHLIGTSGADSTTMVPGGATQRLVQFVSDSYGGGGPKTSSSTGGNETRPTNAAVFFYIKVK